MKRKRKRLTPEERKADQFSTEDLIQKLMTEKGYQAREARMIVRDVLDIIDTPIIENKNIIFRGHFLLKKKNLSTRLVSTGIMRRNNPTMPLSEKIIVARRTSYKFVASSNLRDKIKKHRMPKEDDFNTMMSDQK